jgi:hypothetical protein
MHSEELTLHVELPGIVDDPDPYRAGPDMGVDPNPGPTPLLGIYKENQ